jgi:hypothetical protein
LTYAAARNQFVNGNTSAALNSFGSYLQKFPDGVYAIDASYYRARFTMAKKTGRMRWRLMNLLQQMHRINMLKEPYLLQHGFVFLNLKITIKQKHILSS